MNSPSVGRNLPSSERGRPSQSPTSPHASMTSLAVVVVRLAIQTRHNICSFTAVAERGEGDPFMGMGSECKWREGRNWSRHSGGGCGGQSRMPFQECGAKNLLRAAGRQARRVVQNPDGPQWLSQSLRPPHWLYFQPRLQWLEWLDRHSCGSVRTIRRRRAWDYSSFLPLSLLPGG